MRAFQIKIAIRNSKPPVWRRVIIPAGITFSQLSLILNKVMGWSGDQHFRYEFYHSELCILEGADRFADGYKTYDSLEASNTYIREYLEDNEWFTYIYGTDGQWKHRVTVEKIIDDYEDNYAKVMKYKGDCLAADGEGNSTDRTGDAVEVINDELKTTLFYIWGRGEKRKQQEICQELNSGMNGLQAAKKDKNKKNQINRSKRHQVDDAFKKFAEAIRSSVYNEESKRCSLEYIFQDFEKNMLYEIAVDKGMTGISFCNKQQLIQKLVKQMLQPETARAYFQCLQDEQIEVFKRAQNQETTYITEQGELLHELYMGCYIGVLENGVITVPYDVASLYHSLECEEFHAERKRRSFLNACLKTVGILYGIAPLGIVLEMLNQDMGSSWTEAELRDQIACIPSELLSCVIEGDKVYHKELYPDDKGLLLAQGSKKYYIPSVEEIREISLYGTLSGQEASKALEQYLLQKRMAEESEIRLVVKIIQRQICAGCEMEEIFAILNDFGLLADSEREVKQLMKVLSKLWNETRMLLNRGFTPNEVRGRDQKAIGSADQAGKIVSIQERRKQKIYPNDPCPCGSGKKYKNCCKNK